MNTTSLRGSISNGAKSSGESSAHRPVFRAIACDAAARRKVVALENEDGRSPRKQVGELGLVQVTRKELESNAGDFTQMNRCLVDVIDEAIEICRPPPVVGAIPNDFRRRVLLIDLLNSSS